MPLASCLLPFASCLASCLLPLAFCLLPCLLPLAPRDAIFPTTPYSLLPLL
ncbi:MAG: hypothetical protein F6K56_45955 [Moorea sp. SIO3G5]|nr:hypothetical protein [Moorena sp. SIO3G5]